MVPLQSGLKINVELTYKLRNFGALQLQIKMNKKIQLHDLGNRDYKDTWGYQEELFKQIVDIKIQNRREETNLETPNYFLFVEHPLFPKV